MMTSESPRNMKRVCLDKVPKSFSNLGYISHQEKNAFLIKELLASVDIFNQSNLSASCQALEL